MRVRTWDSLPKPNFVKVAERGIHLWGKGPAGIALPRGAALTNRLIICRRKRTLFLDGQGGTC